jgi:hypothetical protein
MVPSDKKSVRAAEMTALKARADVLESSLELERQYRLMLTGVVERGLASCLSSLRLSSSLIERLIDGEIGDVKRDEAVRWFKEIQDGVERAWVEARLMSDSMVAQRSALQQVQAVGDENSVGLLSKGAQVGPLNGLSRDGLLRAIDAITRRLDSSEGDPEHSVLPRRERE